MSISLSYTFYIESTLTRLKSFLRRNLTNDDKFILKGGGILSCLSIEQLDNGDVIVRKVVTFNPSNKQEYLDLFEKNTQKGIFKKGTEFFDDFWTIIIGNVEYRLIFFTEFQVKKMSKLFNISTNDFELAYRSFILFNLHKAKVMLKLTPILKRLLNGDSITERQAYTCSFLTDTLLKYITIPEENVSFFKCLLEQNSFSTESESANLPDFKDVFLIADIVNDIVQNKKIIDYKEHLLFIMWWKICSMLPLRPSEFLATKYACIYEENNNFYLNVFRSKSKTGEVILNVSKKEDYYREDTIKIDSTLFELIQTYREILTSEFGYKEKEDLFPFDLIKNIGMHKANKRELNTHTIVTKDIISAIDRFYKIVIGEEYGFTVAHRYAENKPETYIDNINPRDLRHIAIINLVLMGCDVLDVMRLAGHTEVNTAFHYYNHVKEFSRGYALGYMNSLKNKTKMKDNDMNIHEDITSDDIKKNEQKEEFNQIMNIINGTENKVTPVDGGICHYSSISHDKSFCLYYEGNHRVCPYFTADSNDTLESELEKIEKEIDANIRILKDLILDMEKVSKFNALYQKSSFALAKNMRDIAYLNNKILRRSN